MKRHLYTITLSLILMFVVFNSCKKDDVYSLYSSNTKMDFGYSELSHEFRFSNIHDEGINWSVSADHDYFEFSKKSGSLSAQKVQEIVVTLDRSTITSDSISTKIYVKSNKGDQLVLDVFIRNFPEKKIRFDFNISSSAYNSVRDEIYFISSSYSSFDIAVYSLADKTLSKYDLDESNNNSYSHISISPNGDKAILYSNRNALVLDLLQMQIIESIYMENRINTAVFAPNDIIYMISDDYDNDIYSYDLSTNELELYDISLGYYDDYFALLHPDGKYIYLVEDDYSSGAQTYKLNIENIIPEKVYGEYISSVVGPAWFNHEGDKIIFESKHFGDVTPEISGFDISNLASIEHQANFISSFCENPINGKYYFDLTYSTSSFKQNEVFVYSPEMQYEKSVIAEDYVSVSGPNGEYQFYDARVVNCFYSREYGLILITSQSSGGSKIALEVIDE